MHKKMRVCALVICLIMLMAAIPALAATGDVGTTVSIGGLGVGTGSEVVPLAGKGAVNVNAYVYTEASITSKKIVMLSKNIVVTYLGESGDFYQITYTNKTGKTYVGFMEKSKLNTVDASTEIGIAPDRAVETGKTTAGANVAKAMAEAKAKNSDVIGYINIAGTNIQQPIMHKASDVHYYSTRDINKKKDNAGMVYSFYNALYRNNTITGHNMRGSNRLLHQLHHLQEKALGYSQCQHSKCPSRSLSNVPDIRAQANRVWEISLLGYNKWEVFSMYEVKKDEPKATLNYNIHPLASDAQTQEWLQKQLSRSQIDFGTKVSVADTFLTIYTCGTEYDSSKAQSRLYFFLKAVS
jgi:hypothetical protein